MTEPLSIHRDGEDWGPYSQEEAAQHIASGSLLASDLAWHEGLPDWQPLGSLPDFSSLFVASPPPPNPATASGTRLLLTPGAGEEVARPEETDAVFLRAQKIYNPHFPALRSSPKASTGRPVRPNRSFRGLPQNANQQHIYLLSVIHLVGESRYSV